MDEPALASALLHMMHLTTQGNDPSSQAFADVEMATALATEMAHKSSASQDLRRKILYLLSTNGFLSPLRAFTGLMPLRRSSCQVKEHYVHGICPARYATSQQKLQQAFSILILQTALYASDNEMGIEPWLATALLEKQISPAYNPTKCNRTLTSKNLRSVSLFESGSTPEQMPSHAWRDRLRESLFRDAGYQQQSVIKIVSEVCRDLEARCDEAEQPYREEQARSRALELKSKDFEDQVAELRIQNQDFLHMIKELETEKSNLRERADTAEVRVQAVSSEAEKLSKAIEVVKTGRSLWSIQFLIWVLLESQDMFWERCA